MALTTSSGPYLRRSTPLATSASRPLFQCAYLAFAAFFLYRVLTVYFILQRNAVFSAAAVRLRVLEARQAPPADARIGGFGLLRDGCDLNPAAAAAAGFTGPMRNGTVELHLAAPLEANGYYFVTSAGPAGSSSDPVRWVFEALAGNGSGTWAEVGASEWQYSYTGEMTLYPQLRYSTPAGGGRRVALDHRAAWPVVISLSSGGVEWVAGMVGCVLAARFGRVSLVRPLFIACAAVDVPLSVVTAVGYHALGLSRQAVEGWLIVWSQLTFLIGIVRFEARVVHVFMVYGVQYWIVQAAREVILYQRRDASLWQIFIPSVGTATFAFGAGILFLRGRALRRARRLVLVDRGRYDAAWDTVRGAEGAAERLGELAALAVSISAGSGSAPPPRQLCNLCVNTALPEPASGEDAPSKSAAATGAAAQEGGPRQVKSLDQLYVQAACVHPFLLRKVQAMAVRYEGCFPVAAGVGAAEAAQDNVAVEAKRFLTLAEAAETGAVLKFARIKAAGRALEKLGRSYGQDASQLVDVCRQSVVFRRLEDLISGLVELAADRDVVILRVKNRLDPSYDATASAGYRDVALNVRMDCTETRRLGVEGHVCELQLLLLPFAEIKSDEGHKRYVAFRNLRGE